MTGKFKCSTSFLEKKLKSAIKNDKIDIAFQAIINLETAVISGYECLARWTLPSGCNVSPEIFIDLADRCKLRNELTRLIMSKALLAAKETKKANGNLFTSFNITAADAIDLNFNKTLMELVETHELDPSDIVIELTERTTEDINILALSLKNLKEQGFKIALDDFGTGYSNIDLLCQIDFDIIKIDRIYMTSINKCSVGNIVFEMAIDAFIKSGVVVIVEGIENAEQAKYLHKKYPMIKGQGWFYSKPQRIESSPF